MGVVSTHSRPKAAETENQPIPPIPQFQHTAARRRLLLALIQNLPSHTVSTHSRPKAAEIRFAFFKFPTEFQHTAARRRLPGRPRGRLDTRAFQHTAARRRLKELLGTDNLHGVFQHTAARRRLPLRGGVMYANVMVSTHSRPKAAANLNCCVIFYSFSFNTQPPEGG